jgi:hypothetical protein
VAPAEATGVASPPVVAAGGAYIQDAASATGAPARTFAAAGGPGGAIGDAANPPAVVVEEACWGRTSRPRCHRTKQRKRQGE